MGFLLFLKRVILFEVSLRVKINIEEAPCTPLDRHADFSYKFCSGLKETARLLGGWH
jgi:hypothetical protein